MNLKENYERFFGKIEPKREIEKTQLTEQQKQRFTNISKLCAQKYPHAPLTLKEGWVWIGSKKLENIEEFNKRSSINIQELVRSFQLSGKKGVI